MFLIAGVGAERLVVLEAKSPTVALSLFVVVLWTWATRTRGERHEPRRFLGALHAR
jgi:hypothetical protein